MDSSATITAAATTVVDLVKEAAAPGMLEAAEVAIACMAMEGDHKHHDAPCWLDALTLAHAKAKATP